MEKESRWRFNPSGDPTPLANEGDPLPPRHSSSSAGHHHRDQNELGVSESSSIGSTQEVPAPPDLARAVPLALVPPLRPPRHPPAYETRCRIEKRTSPPAYPRHVAALAPLLPPPAQPTPSRAGALLPQLVLHPPEIATARTPRAGQLLPCGGTESLWSYGMRECAQLGERGGETR